VNARIGEKSKNAPILQSGELYRTKGWELVTSLNPGS